MIKCSYFLGKGEMKKDYRGSCRILYITMKKAPVFIVVLLFISIITTGRLVWVELFKPSGQSYAVNGLLNLRDGNEGAGRTITLDGEWEFYPGVFLMSDGSDQAPLEFSPQSIDVPSDWSTRLQPNGSSPYGFGSYRLRILVDSEDEVYSIYVPSIRSSSQLYVNGRLIANSGHPAPNAKDYRAENIPYTATFTADDQGMIELVIQAANFNDSRGGGMIRSLKFGTNEDIYREKQYSMAAQQLTAAAMIIHAAYLLVFFIIERNKFWLYFAVAILTFMFILLNSSEDKLLQQWLSISHAWSFKLLVFGLIILFYSILQMVSTELPEAWRAKVLRAYGVAAIIGIGVGIWLPTQNNEAMQYVIFLCAVPIIALFIVSVLRMAVSGIRKSLMQFLAFLAFANHMVWWMVFLLTGIKVIFYPFDLILGMLLLSYIWIKRYFVLYTEQKQLTVKLEEVNRKKDEFLANTSHELRNPLHSMINISQVVLERERNAINDISVREMETVVKVGQRMSFMLNDLLDVARLKDSSLRLNIESVSLQPIISGVMDLIRFMTVGKPIVLTNRVPEHFPKVLADENRLIQILFNLLHNAVKFTHQGEVYVEAYTEKGLVFVIVADSGVGMDEPTLQRVFEPYEQANSINGYEGGFGLGLSICRQLVELHGGTITVESALAKGTRFTFTLSLDGSSEMEAAPEISSKNASDSSQDLAAAAASLELYDRKAGISGSLQLPVKDKPRILAVDDDALNLNVLGSILSHEDYSTVMVTNGVEALELIHAQESQEWDLVIADIMMPGMSGYELTQKIRERYAVSELPVLLITARSRPEDIEKGFWAGANDYVTKPVDARELRARVRALTRLTSSTRERIRMEAAWLQAQIEPHFFLNTLNSIAALHTINSESMLELIEHFGDYLREKFKFQNVGELVPLNDELTLVRSYLFIEQTRFEDRLQVEWEIDRNIELLRIPPYSIQPLVENAIRHGLMKRAEGGTVRITLRKQGDIAEISVFDDGVGMDEEIVSRLLEANAAGGIALRNVDLRLKRLYGVGLKIASTPGKGTTVSFVVC